jgi:hypothetical protein
MLSIDNGWAMDIQNMSVPTETRQSSGRFAVDVNHAVCVQSAGTDCPLDTVRTISEGGQFISALEQRAVENPVAQVSQNFWQFEHYIVMADLII